MFKLTSDYQPIDEQEKAASGLVKGISKNIKDQVLVGVTGSGKTYTMAQVIQRTQKPALIISHNKTLAAQLYQEMHDFFPDNAVTYFVSYYDYYQPEAYIPSTDTYIEKEAQINDQIDKLRLRATTDLLTRDDVIVVASVSCIYNIGSPKEYGNFTIELAEGKEFTQSACVQDMVSLQYDRSEFDFKRGTFRVRGNRIDVYPAYQDIGIRIEFDHEKIVSINAIDPLTGKHVESLKAYILYPSKHYLIAPDAFTKAEEQIRRDLFEESAALKALGKDIEARRLIQRVTHDMEMLREIGYVNGIENYSRYFDGREPGATPFSLLHYFHHRFGNDWTVFIDESHITVPQVHGMYNGDQARKKVLIDHGFRLKASFDNRPMKFDEFYGVIPHAVYISATPADWELEKAGTNTVEQLVRPTGIVDPEITVRPTETEVQDVIEEIATRAEKGERTLVTTLTKKMAEDLTTYLQERGVKAAYLHSDIKTLTRSSILQKLRNQEYDVLIGVNLLREGLDLPEVTLVAILDADKEGFLRSRTSLIQTMGRAARNINGVVILYADRITNSMKLAMDEVLRRREYQLAYNKEHNITPQTIIKKIRDPLLPDAPEDLDGGRAPDVLTLERRLDEIDTNTMTSYDRTKLVKQLERQLKSYVDDLNFEAAILVRDKIKEFEGYR
jgi:excinuclease ABC subunit B